MAVTPGAYHWDFGFLAENSDALLSGLWGTLKLAGVACIIGSILSIPLTLGLRAKSKAIRWPCFAVTEAGRGIPLLVLLVWVHYVMPSFGVSLPAFWSAGLALSVNLAAFLADVLRGGIAAIPVGHIEAAEALGLTRRQVIKRVIVPETIRRTLPTISAFYVSALKLTTLASVIGATELLFRVRLLNSDQPHPLELYTFLAIAFLLMVIPLAICSRLLETHPWFALYPKTK